MAAARDQAARILRPEPDADNESGRDASAELAASLRAHLSEETVSRRHADMPAVLAAQRKLTLEGDRCRLAINAT